ncbi:MAG TPA: glycosyltransferase family 2 protein [Chitinophaga sp.]|uniref:glycosyltransferase family 2 protein n=1 Tax=Chitinophaga sp. TaxID=1869181 RepID=UPI002B9AEC23|nr:glycosyltransferase family 2 protein [Chitinophaga sp.]HVI44696.1 glycosyltransferase family 2 protein [Chitinophaga sp.]
MNKKGKKLSVIIPVYNEESTITAILEKIMQVELPGDVSRELILVNDCSTDNSESRILEYLGTCKEGTIVYLKHAENKGKGAAIRTGIPKATGDYILIQDADMEYEPGDYPLLLQDLLSGESKVVYGSRFLNKVNKHSYHSFYWGGRLVTFVTNLLYRLQLTDVPTCYKMFDAALLRSINLECTRFEFCPEVTAKVAKLGHRIVEKPIYYYPRSFSEGKKIKWQDGIEAIWTLVKYRFSN